MDLLEKYYICSKRHCSKKTKNVVRDIIGEIYKKKFGYRIKFPLYSIYKIFCCLSAVCFFFDYLWHGMLTRKI